MSLFGSGRRQSSAKNAVGRYLAYAIGEIVLVVIGILFAVEINNWNEARRDRESEQALLKGLLQEMVENRNELVKTRSYHKRSESAVRKLIQIYQGDYRQHRSNELDSLFAEVQWAWTFDPRLGVLNSIKTTGKINIIRNPKIQSFVTSFEELANDSREESITIKSLIITQFLPVVNQYISAGQRDKYLGADIGGTRFPPNYEGLFNNRAAESIIAYIYFWRTDERAEEDEVLARLNESIAIVESEIKK